jgi:hypothetical protein
MLSSRSVSIYEPTSAWIGEVVVAGVLDALHGKRGRFLDPRCSSDKKIRDDHELALSDGQEWRHQREEVFSQDIDFFSPDPVQFAYDSVESTVLPGAYRSSPALSRPVHGGS